MPGRRVVVTGMGAITPVGNTLDAYWANLIGGVCGIAPLERDDKEDYEIKVAAVVRDFDPLQYIDRKEARRMDRYCQFAVAASMQAIEDSDLDIASYGAKRVGTIIGSGIGGLETLETEYKKFYLGGGPSRISPLFIPMMISNMAAGRVSMLLGSKGANYCVTTACASGTHAIGEAFRWIKYGHVDACIAGGAEAPLTGIAIAGFTNMMALTKTGDPIRASIPFDLNRSGFVIGEGAGILILESLESALNRNAHIYCEIVGYGATSDAYHITSPDPEGAGAAQAMGLAMQEGGVRSETVDYVNAHGTSTPLNDKFETLSIKAALGETAYRTSVSSTKSMTGHLLGAAGAIEAIACVMAIRDGKIPPTIGLIDPDPECDLDYTPGRAIEKKVRVALSNSLGFGGHNGTLCLKEMEG
ncbi:MAG: beta-ketoacyl-ACP synthase II [Clostridiaceae bacterium]|nr:beta-ketoacyl-ACP synthase II [Clostridiaceae bacterium]